MDVGKMLDQVRGSASLLDCDGLLRRGRHCDELDVQMSVLLKLGLLGEKRRWSERKLGASMVQV